MLISQKKLTGCLLKLKRSLTAPVCLPSPSYQEWQSRLEGNFWPHMHLFYFILRAECSHYSRCKAARDGAAVPEIHRGSVNSFLAQSTSSLVWLTEHWRISFSVPWQSANNVLACGTFVWCSIIPFADKRSCPRLFMNTDDTWGKSEKQDVERLRF